MERVFPSLLPEFYRLSIHMSARGRRRHRPPARPFPLLRKVIYFMCQKTRDMEFISTMVAGRALRLADTSLSLAEQTTKESDVGEQREEIADENFFFHMPDSINAKGSSGASP